ncbi:MAG: threonine synthase [candidate division NC10 bacterium]|nr:threonine synthase [candidate division NC10 bacterium]
MNPERSTEFGVRWHGVIHRYRDYLPVTEKTPVITLQEGNTPLIRADRLEEALDSRVELFLKFEGANPTGSFKDRGMTVAVSKAVEEKMTAVVCASTGNTSASASAYAARAGCHAYVVVPKGNVAMGKISQALVHGARLILLQGNFDEAFEIVKEISEKYPVALVNSINPFRIEGQKTAAFEVCEQLGRSPDAVCIPVGNAGNISAYWKGFREYREAGRIQGLPRMIGWQAEGAAPIVRGAVVKHPETVASAIRIGNPANWSMARAAIEESHGEIGLVSDAEILDAYRQVAQLEGIFCEPASAAAVAGLVKQCREGKIPRGAQVVCILTGHGLKDPEVALTLAPPLQPVEANLEAVVEAMGLN